MKYELRKPWNGLAKGEVIDVERPVAELLAERGIIDRLPPRLKRKPEGAAQMPRPSAIKQFLKRG